MLGPRHIVLRVQYDRQPQYGRSLEWIAPELKGARMTMTEDRISDPQPARTWEGTVDGPTFARFAQAWRLPVDFVEPALPTASGIRDLAPHRYTLDGMNWEQSGRSPIVCVSLEVMPLLSPVGMPTVPSGARSSSTIDTPRCEPTRRSCAREVQEGWKAVNGDRRAHSQSAPSKTGRRPAAL